VAAWSSALRWVRCFRTHRRGAARPAPPAPLQYCPTWAGGDASAPPLPNGQLDSGWIQLNYTQASPSSIAVDLTPLNGSAPTAVRYAWGIINCCDLTDPTLYVTHGCVAACPIMSASGLPANPFQAKIVGGTCQCIDPQVCDGTAGVVV
jgi:hypothetical protein